MRAHPLADRFPMLPDDELDRLAEDIRENGLRNPIVLDSDGLILDGRNRWAACERAGVTPETVPFDGDDVAAFVLSVNVARRHLTTGQQAMSTALVLVDAGKRLDNGRWKPGSLAASQDLGSGWAESMRRAGVILDHAPDLAPAVVDGTLALDAAHRQAEQRRDADRQLLAEQERIEAEEADARTRLAEVAPKYLDRFPSARVALTAWEDDHRREAAEARREKAATEASERREKADAEQAVAMFADSLVALDQLAFPEARTRLHSQWRTAPLAAKPHARNLHNPESLRTLAANLTAYANEMENHHG